MHVLYLVEAVFSHRDYDRFGVAFMRANGHDVTVVDMTGLSQPRLPRDRSHYGDLADVTIHVADTLDALRGLQDVRDRADILISAIGSVGVTPENIAVFRWLSAARGIYVKVHCDSYPGISRFKGEPRRVHERVRDITRRMREGQISARRSIMARLPMDWLGVRPADFVIYGGRNSRSTSRLIHSRTREIWAHSFDHEIFRNLRDTIGAQSDTAVFIDEYLPHHPDLATRGQGAPVDPAYYYSALRQFFDRVETETGLRVIVAACPRADYSNQPGIFGDREVAFMQTGRLIGESRLVLAHRSTAIGFAVMFRRPVVLFALKDTLTHVNHRIPSLAYAEALNRPIQVVDGSTAYSLADALSIDEKAYDRFMGDFVKTPGSPDAPLWRIVLDGVGAR